jgi:DNA (cytosine-5)-methyltransferase 1
MPLTVGSLFSGIGGFDLGLERAGMVVKWQVERDPWCQKILAKHWPAVPRYTNVEDVGSNLECVDLICGGFPCQPVSVAGQRHGTADDRWLWPEFRRVVGLLRPRYVLVENVPGLFTANGGHAFGEVIGDLADLGYNAEWTVLSAADVGAPHLRKRVWIVADAQRSRSRLQPRDTETRGQRGEHSRASQPTLVSPDNGPSRAKGTDTGREDVADADRTGPQGRELLPKRRGERVARTSRMADAPIGGQWRTEPDVGRVADGIPRRVDRLRGLGNAIVPQCAEWIGRQLVQANGPKGKALTSGPL